MNQTLIGFDIVNSTSFTQFWFVHITQPGIVNITVILFDFNGSTAFQNQVHYELKPLPITTSSQTLDLNSLFKEYPIVFIILSALGIGTMVYVPVRVTQQVLQKRKNANLFLTTSDHPKNTPFDIKGRKNSYFRKTFEDNTIPFQIRLNFLLTCSNIVSFQLYNTVTNELILQFQTKRHLFNQINSAHYLELMKSLQSAPHAKKDAWEIPLPQDQLLLKKWDCEHLSVIVIFSDKSEYNSPLFQNGINLYLSRSVSTVPVIASTLRIQKEKLITNLHEIFNIWLACPIQISPDSQSDVKYKKKLLNEAFQVSSLPSNLRREIEHDVENLTVNEIQDLLTRIQNSLQNPSEPQDNQIDDEIKQ
jgi:hypothetical protein